MDKRIEENWELIKRFLVQHHEDGDEDSLFCRFSEIMQSHEKLKQDNETLNRILDDMCQPF